jgi:hypothetical protein
MSLALCHSILKRMEYQPSAETIMSFAFFEARYISTDCVRRSSQMRILGLNPVWYWFATKHWVNIRFLRAL